MIQIDEIVLRVPGMTEADGRTLGKAVAAKLAQRLPGEVPGSQGGQAGRIGQIDIGLQMAVRSPEALAEKIVEQILVKLKIATS
jgi:hypothetical protein